jgi:hypothetical protein
VSDAYRETEPYPLAVRAGQIGYVLEMQLDNCRDHQDTVAVITRVVVDGDDPACRSASKFIGPSYTEAQASDVADWHGRTVTRRRPLAASRSVPRAAPDRAARRGANGLECDIDFEGATYFLSWATIRVTDATGMDRWRKRLFVAIWRNSANPVEYLRLPDRRAITMGWEVPL